MSILKDYKVNFVVKRVKNSDYKLMKSISPSLDELFFEFRRIDECNMLLGIIDQQLSNPQSGEYFFPTQGLQLIKVTHSMTSIYNDVYEYKANPNMTPNYKLPTEDLKEITISWKKFVNGNNLIL